MILHANNDNYNDNEIEKEITMQRSGRHAWIVTICLVVGLFLSNTSCEAWITPPQQKALGRIPRTSIVSSTRPTLDTSLSSHEDSLQKQHSWLGEKKSLDDFLSHQFRRGCSYGFAICVMASTLFLASPPQPCYADTAMESHSTQQHALASSWNSNKIFERMNRRSITNQPSLERQATISTSVSTKLTSFGNGSPHLLLSSTVQAPGAVIDEVWTLVDKYYIDRSFNGQDWTSMKEKYQGQLKSKLGGRTEPQDDQDEMNLVTNMVKTLGDKYSRMLTVEQYTAIQKYDLIGVGVTLMPDPNGAAEKGKTPEIIVGAPPIGGSAADRAGLQVGDTVTKINGVSTQGRTAFDIIDQISENPNAKTVTMTIRSSDSPERDVVMERQFQEVKNPIRYAISERRKDGTTVGFIRISEFNSLIKANLEDALKNLKAQGANAFVIDLRRNGGGAFQSAVEVSGLFYEDRVATYVVDGTTATLPFKTAKGQVLIDPSDPVVLWIDGGSASAAEVLAASLHDNCKAVTVGDKSFGKGLIQAVYGLKNGAGLVLTVAKYVTPTQSEIQGLGIQPDIAGQDIVPPPLLSLLTGTADTSRIDFADVRNRLSPEMCPSIPPKP